VSAPPPAVSRLLLLGCGKMGRAMLDGWLAAGTVGAVEAVEPSADAVPADPRVASRRSAAEVPDGPVDVLVLAVKPQVMDAAAPAVARHVGPGTLVVSIAAGKTIATFEAVYGAGVPVVRAMPNTPAAVGRGITVCVASAAVTAAQRGLADRLLRAVGEVAWVEDEALIDPVTAVSGGGPAYVFLLIEALAEAGRKAGLPADLSMRIARATVVGSGELARLSPEPASRLREDVTSPGGTTRAALDVLMAETGGIQDLFDRAVAAATRRAGELR
jgi:pyrroline-5-carboxylate reductase